MEHVEGSIGVEGGIKLYYQGWLADARPRAILVVAHGLAEHGGRYMNLANRLVPCGYSVYCMDHRGHGKSEGKRCYADKFSCYLADLDAFIKLVGQKHNGAPLFLIGHSMGGTIAAAYTAGYRNGLAGLILSGAALKPGDSITPFHIMLARILSTLAPHCGVTRLKAAAVSQDESVVNAYRADPLVYRGKICARLGSELIRTIQNLQEQMRNIDLPLLILHGAADRLAEPEGSRILYWTASSGDKTLKLYESFHHELFNEPGREQVFLDIKTWLDART